MAPGGTLMIHLPIYILPSNRNLFNKISKIRKLVADVKARYKRFLLGRGFWTPYMRGLRYEVDWLYRQLGAGGFVEIEFRIFDVRSNGGTHQFVLARKAR
jgi:hypothetical protein